MVNFLQIDELVSRRWPTQQKEEKIQQEYSSFSEKIHNNLQRSLEETLIQEMKKETEGQVAIYQRSAKLTVQLHEVVTPSFSKKMNSIPLTSEELTKSEIQKTSLNQQNFLKKKVLEENGHNTTEAINAAKVLQEELEIPSVASEVIESKQESLLTKHPSFAEKEVLKESVVSAVEVVNAGNLLQKESEVFSVASGMIESKKSPLLSNQQNFLKREFVGEIENGNAESISSMQLLQEGAEYTLSRNLNTLSLTDTEYKENRQEQNQSGLQSPLEKLTVKEAKEEGTDLLKLKRLVQEEFAPEISSQFQNPAKLVRLLQEGTDYSLSQKMNTASLTSNGSMESREEQGQSSFRFSLEQKSAGELSEEGGELAKLVRAIQEGKGAALFQKTGDASLDNAGWTSGKQWQIPSKQQNLDREPMKESKVAVAAPAKVMQGANSVVLPQEVPGDPVITTEALENAGVQQPPKQEGLDKFNPPVKEPKVAVVDPAKVMQGANSVVLSQEVPDPATPTKIFQETRSFAFPQEVTRDSFVIGEVADLVNSTQLFQDIVRTPFVNDKVIEGEEESDLFNLQNSLGKRFTEIGKDKAIELGNLTGLFSTERVATPQRKTNDDSLSEPETKEVIAVLLTLSDQALVLQQLQGNSASFSELSQMLGQFLSDYGNIQLQELPPEETQKLVTYLETVNAGQLTMNASTSIGQILIQWTTDVSNAQVQTEQVNLLSYSKEPFVYEGMEKIDSDIVKDKSEQETVSSSFTESLSGALDLTSKAMRVQGHESIKPENILSSDLDKTLKQKVEEIQKFVVKNERIFLQLNPEKLGTVEVYLKKQQDSIQVHVQTSREESQKQLDIIFEDLKAKLKEQDIQIEITYTERERQERQEQRGEQREQAYRKQQHQEQEKQQENPFKRLWEGIGND